MQISRYITIPGGNMILKLRPDNERWDIPNIIPYNGTENFCKFIWIQIPYNESNRRNLQFGFYI